LPYQQPEHWSQFKSDVLDQRRERVCLHYLWLHLGLQSSGPDYSSTSLSELAIRTEMKPSVRLSKPLSMYGSSYKYGSRIHDSASTLIEILEFGRSHMGDTMALHLRRASHYVVVFIPLTVCACRHFLQQNAAIRLGTLKGIPINLKVLGIGNGLTVWRSGMPAG
jgi:hypothetical protein